MRRSALPGRVQLRHRLVEEDPDLADQPGRAHQLQQRIPALVAPDVFMLGLSPLQNLLLFWAVLA